MDKSFKHYLVVETENLTADQLQEILDNATHGFPEKQIEHVIGTKIVLSYESILNERGRAEAYFSSVSSKGRADG